MLDEIHELKIKLVELEDKKNNQDMSINQLDYVYKEINRLKILIKNYEKK